MVSSYRISSTTADAALVKAVVGTWRPKPNCEFHVSVKVMRRSYCVVVTDGPRGEATQIVVYGGHNTSRTLRPDERKAFMAKRVAFLKKQWDAIQPEPETTAWYNKWFCENTIDAGREGTVRFYETVLATFNERMTEEGDTPLDVLKEQYDEWHACEGHESLDGAHMGETVYCDGTCRVWSD